MFSSSAGYRYITLLIHIKYIEYLNWLNKHCINSKPPRHLEMASKEKCKRKEAFHRAGCVEMNLSIIYVALIHISHVSQYLNIFQMNMDENSFLLEIYREQRMA